MNSQQSLSNEDEDIDPAEIEAAADETPTTSRRRNSIRTPKITLRGRSAVCFRNRTTSAAGGRGRPSPSNWSMKDRRGRS